MAALSQTLSGHDKAGGTFSGMNWTVDLWVWLALGGAFFQNLRSLQQRRLTGLLSQGGASYSRFLFALPLAWIYALSWSPEFAPAFAPAFLSYCLAGGAAQILGTWCLVGAVADGGFAAGTAYSKTEAAQTALFGLVLLGDPVTGPLLAAIALSLVGVALLFGGARDPVAAGGLGSARRAGLGLGAAAGFALSAVCFRGAAQTLQPDSVSATMAAAALTLAFTLTLQTLLQGLWLRWREPAQLGRVLAAWRGCVPVGVTGMLASVCWFSGVALYSAAAVRAVGQIEMVFALLTGVLLFRERPGLRELVAIALIAMAVLLLAIGDPGVIGDPGAIEQS